MKLMFLHLSDMHISDRKGYNSFQLDKIADALNACGPVDRILVIISGDLAFSGKKYQYHTVRSCIGQIISTYKAKSGHKAFIDVICVPGNHDMDYNGNCMDSNALQCIKKSDSYDKHLKSQTDMQQAFFEYANYNQCFKDGPMYSRRILNYNGFSVEVNMINSGVFSIKDEDKGLHFIPQYCINELNAPSGADFVITVMHHAPDWYTDSIKSQLEAVIYEKSSIVFYGHEHKISNKQISHEDLPAAVIQAGGTLCMNDNWTNSTFYVGVFDTTDFKYTHSKLAWNPVQKQYEQAELRSKLLPPKPSAEKRIRIRSEFEKELRKDPKHERLSGNFLDYFVFPRIQADELNGDDVGKEYISESEFIDVIKSKKKILIYGGYNSGKTTLLKALFLKLREEYEVLFCNTENIHGKNADRIIRNCFTDIYGNDPSDFSRFEQVPKEKRVVIIDDIDTIKQESLECFVERLSESFEHIILSSKQMLDISLFDRLKVMLKANDSVFRYRIMPYFTDKRSELIRRVVALKAEDNATVEATARTLTQAINAQKRFINLDPDFIIHYVEYFCNNLGDVNNNDNGVFSKVFEANLTSALSRFQTPILSVDKLFIILAKVAHCIHFSKAYPISQDLIVDIIKSYNADYGASVKYFDVMRAVIGAKIMLDDGAGGFRFANRNYLAYFVAREINSQYNATMNDEDLQRVLKCSCFGINADILLFISYITDNIRILRLVLHMANELTKDWSEFDFQENMPAFLQAEHVHEVLPPSPEAKLQESAAELEEERNGLDQIQTVGIYDYVDEDADTMVNQIVRACSLLMVVAKCLPNFEHIMLKPDKDAFVNTIYRLPNRIFGLWATETDKNVSEVIHFFKEQSRDYYARQKVVNDDDILRALQWASISMLLDLYNLTVYHSAKDNTHPYMSAYPYANNSTHYLEHIMVMERVENGSRFVEEALDLKGKCKKTLEHVALKRAVCHALVFMNDLDHRANDRLNAEFFPARDTQKRLIAQRVRYIGKRGG